MKKMLWMAALTSVALAGCVNEEVADVSKNQQGKELIFGTPVMYNQSRAVGEILGTEYPDDEQFVVYAVQHNASFAGWQGENVMKNDNDEPITFFPEIGVVVKKSQDNNYWHIMGDTKYLWPKNEDKDGDDEIDTDYKLTFAAHSPSRLNQHAEEVSYGRYGLSIDGFQMPEDPKLHFDLMYSTRTIDATTSPVLINFKHALSSIRFMFVKQALDTNGPFAVNIKKVEITGEINNKGNFSQNIENVADVSGNPMWTELEIVKKQEDESYNYVLFNDNFSVPEGTSVELPKTNVASFMAIPQTVNDKMKVKITYTVQSYENSDAQEDVVEIAFTQFIKPNSNQWVDAWARGHRYIYHVHFGALQEIFFEPTISDEWVTEATAGVYEIGNVTSTTP